MDPNTPLTIALRSIHPNKNPVIPEGEKKCLLTYIKDYRVTAKVKIVLKCPYFIEQIEAEPSILEDQLPIEIRMTAQKHQASVESILTCLEYLSNESTDSLEITTENMLSLLISANFLKIYNLEDYLAEYVGGHMTIPLAVFVFNAAV
jgi:hypothetical protein